MVGFRIKTGGIAAVVASLFALLSVGQGLAHSSASQILPSLIHGVQVANITDNTVTIAWITDAAIPGSGSIVYGLAPSSAFHVVNETAPPTGARGDIHVVQVTNLAPSTTYYFAVEEGGSEDNNGGQYYDVRTGPVLSGQNAGRSVSGIVTLSDGHSPAPGVLISFTVLDNVGLNGTGSSTSATEAAVTNANGAWTIPLQPRTADNSAVFSYTSNGSSDFVQYSVEAAALGDGPLQTISLLLDGNGHLNVPSVSISASAATDTPAPSATPSVTPTQTWTQTAAPSATATFTPTPTSESQAAFSPEPVFPTTTPRSVLEPVLPSPTEEVFPVQVAPGVPTVEFVLPPPRPTIARPATPVATPTARPSSSIQASAPTANATQTVEPVRPTAVAAPSFPFVSTPLPNIVTASLSSSGFAATPPPAATGSPTPKAVISVSGGGKPVSTDTLPVVAKTLFASAFLVIALGATLVWIGVSRRLRDS